MIALTAIGAFLALFALALTLKNLGQYERPPAHASTDDGQSASQSASTESQAESQRESGSVAVCIPARNEAENIEACIRGFLAQDVPDVQVWVYDDQSDDATPEILTRLSAEDARVHAAPTQPLPDGWNGKQHACLRSAEAAMASANPPEWLLFTDADVRVEPGAVRGALDAAAERKADLVSTFPKQITGTLSEMLVVPMIFFLLFSYLPFGRMRSTNDPAASAGCGQFLFVRSSVYQSIGGHGVCKNSMHDGIKLPRAIRAAGHHTDLFDGTHLASVRMYTGLSQTWRGFAKNAYEGLGSPVLLVVLTIMHAIGHVLPWVILACVAFLPGVVPTFPAVLAAIAVLINTTHRIVLAVRFGHPPVIALLHPIAVTLMTLVQWHSYIVHLRGARTWRGRVMTASG